MQTFQEKMAAAKTGTPAPAPAVSRETDIEEFLYALHTAKGFAANVSTFAADGQFRAAILDFEPSWIALIEAAKAKTAPGVASQLNRPSPLHVMDVDGQWILTPLPVPAYVNTPASSMINPTPANPPTSFQAPALPTGELAAPPTAIPETIQPAPHAPRRRMAGTF
jgi:hypothetical protein